MNTSNLAVVGLAFTLMAGVAHEAVDRAWLPGSALSDRDSRQPAFVLAQADGCDAPANPVVAENCQPGTTDWHITNESDDITGYASASSVNVGESITFFVNTDAAMYDIALFRSGYYGGAGGRLVQAIPNLPGQKQPACDIDAHTGLVSCSNWSPSYRLTIAADWVSGVYLAKLTRPDTGGENLIWFVVRDDARDSDVLVQFADADYQAYNGYGGKSLYTFNSGYCTTASGRPRAVQVSFDRPYYTTYFFNTYLFSDYPLVHWLEAQGYDVTYFTNADTHRSGTPGQHNELLDHRAFLSASHDEYWSQEVRDAITAARDAGVHLMFLSANTGYWRIRYEPDPRTGAPDRIVTGYKSTESGPPDPSGHATGTWRDPNSVDDPENALFGVMYVGDNDIHYFPLRVSAEQAQDRIYRHTGLQSMPPGTYVEIGTQIVGWEWDAVVDNGRAPEGVQILAASPTYGALLADAGRGYRLGAAAAHTVRYVAPSGAIVFSSGTILWSWGLAIVEPDVRLQQITLNVLADMGVQPATPADVLITDAQSPNGEQTLDTSGNVYRPVAGGRAPGLSNVQASATETEATISWDTDLPADGQVWVRVEIGDTYLPPIVGDAVHREPLTAHKLTIFGLESNTTYYYQIASADEFMNVSISGVMSFRTDGDSLFTRVKQIARPVYRLARCWVEANTPAAVLMAGAGVLALGAIGWSAWHTWRRRRAG